MSTLERDVQRVTSAITQLGVTISVNAEPFMRTANRLARQVRRMSRTLPPGHGQRYHGNRVRR